jgi:hypothetical protein
MDVCRLPELEEAIVAWYSARHAYERVDSTSHLTVYCKCTDELGQIFSQWQTEEPELFEQLRLFLSA